MMQVLRKCDVMVVSHGLDADSLRRSLLIPMPTVEDALSAALKTHGNNARVVVIPEGPYVTPVPPNGLNGGH
jgi:nickel-dependent lactate racemase